MLAVEGPHQPSGGSNHYPAGCGASSAFYREVRQHLFFRVVLVEDLALSESCARDFEAAYSWVELADWIPSVLAGISDPRTIKRGVCMAGHKALYCDEWGGLPDKEFLALLDPKLADLRDRLYEKA